MEPMNNITNIMAKENNWSVNSVTTVLNLLSEGATIPFIARYRKEMTGGRISLFSFCCRSGRIS